MKKLTTITSIMILSLLNFLHAKEIEVGADAPKFTAKIQTGETIDFGSIFSTGYTLVYFYPKADTPGCTAQACSLRDSWEELSAKGIRIYGVSYDSEKDQTSFIEKYNLPFDLIADEDKKVSNAFGRGLFMRQAFLIKDGKVIWRDLNASTKTQAADVKKALSDLGLMQFYSIE